MEDRLGLLIESKKDLAEWRAKPALERVEVKPLPNGYYQDVANPNLVYSQLEFDRLQNLYKDVHIAINEPTTSTFEQNYQYLQTNIDDTSKMLETAEQNLVDSESEIENGNTNSWKIEEFENTAELETYQAQENELSLV